MSACLSKGVLTLSVDLESDDASLGIAERRALDATIDRILELLEKYELPVTWGAAEPAHAAVAQRIIAGRPGHEIAILGDATWVGREAGRSLFGRELARRTAQARAAGLAVSSLMLKTAMLDEHCDLAIKHEITALRHAGADRTTSAARRFQPQTLRFGLWSFPVSLVLPQQSRWLPGGGGGHAARALLNQAIVQRGLIQWAIDAPRLAQRGYAAERLLARVLRYAERRRRQGVLEIATLGSVVEKLSVLHQSQPSRSILRSAA